MKNPLDVVGGLVGQGGMTNATRSALAAVRLLATRPPSTETLVALADVRAMVKGGR